MMETFLLGGRKFVPVTEDTITIEHDLYFHGLAGKAGLQFVKGARESAEDFGARILQETVQSGQTLELLGCLIVPEDVGAEKWTPDEARKTAAFVGKLRGDADKAQVRALILSMLIDFFRCGLASIWTTATSSPLKGGQPEPEAQPTASSGAATGAGETS